MSLHDRVIEFLKERRLRIIEGKINCVPLPFERFRDVFPGIEKAKYYQVTANQKVGKSKFCDFIFLYEPLCYFIEHPDVLRIKVFYFTLEESKQEKYLGFLSYLLFKLSDIRMSAKDLKSTSSDKVVPEEILALFETDLYQKYIKAFEENVVFIDDIRNPTGINKYLRDYALNHGHFEYKTGLVKNDVTGKMEEGEVIDYYQPDDDEEYRIVIMDNYANMTLESGRSKMDNIDKMSKYGITLRDQLGYTIAAIQHQAQAQEGIENIKLNKLEPSADGLADCKTTIRDVNTSIGLFSPYKYGLREYEGYDITKFKNNIRFLKVIEDRDSGAGGMSCPLFFDGATSTFIELPRPDNKQELERVYRYMEDRVRKPAVFMAFTIMNRKKHQYSKGVLGKEIYRYLCSLFKF